LHGAYESDGLVIREFNERMAGVLRDFGLDPASRELVPFRCECGRCAESLPLTFGEYEAVRRHPELGVVLPGHEEPTDRLAASTRRFALVVRYGSSGVT
jgi:hypothetical protein